MAAAMRNGFMRAARPRIPSEIDQNRSKIDRNRGVIPIQSPSELILALLPRLQLLVHHPRARRSPESEQKKCRCKGKTSTKRALKGL